MTYTARRPEAAARTIVSATAPILDFRVVSVGAGEILAVWSEEGGKTYARQITSQPANDVPVLVAGSGAIVGDGPKLASRAGHSARGAFGRA